jgi:hypothetical protein
VNCKEVIELVDAYLDGELDPVTNREIEGHLQKCSACDQLFKEHHAVVGAIGAVAPYHKAPAGLRERVQASLRDQIPASVAGAAPELESDVTRKQRDVRTLLFEMPWNWAGPCCRSRCGRAACVELGAGLAATGCRTIPGHGTCRQSRALADGGPSHGCGFLGPAHRQAVVRRQARFCAFSGQPRQRRISASRGDDSIILVTDQWPLWFTTGVSTSLTYLSGQLRPVTRKPRKRSVAKAISFSIGSITTSVTGPFRMPAATSWWRLRN